MLCWLGVPGEDYAAAIAADVDVTAYSVAELARSPRRSAPAGRPARSSSRSTPGCPAAAPRSTTGPTWSPRPRAGEERRRLDGHRHLVALRLRRRARPPRQRRAGGGLPRGARASPSAAGLRPEVRHLANSAAAILRPELALRPGALRPRVVRPRPRARPHPRPRACVPAMTAARRARAGQAARRRRGRLLRPHLARTATRPPSAWCRSGTATGCRATRATAPRCWSAAGAARSGAGSAWTSSSSTSATTPVAAGDEVVLFGPGAQGEPTAQDWAEACGTISYEIVTRIGGRFVRRYVDEGQDMSIRRRIIGAVASAAGVAGRRCGRRRRPPAPGDRPARRRRRDAASARCAATADDGDRRRRRPAARRGRRGAPSTDGDARELTVVFVHGYALNLDCWHFQRAAFRGPVRTVFYDQRSHGRSGRSQQANATIDQLGRDLLHGDRRTSRRTARSCWSATRWAA